MSDITLLNPTGSFVGKHLKFDTTDNQTDGNIRYVLHDGTSPTNNGYIMYHDSTSSITGFPNGQCWQDTSIYGPPTDLSNDNTNFAGSGGAVADATTIYIKDGTSTASFTSPYFNAGSGSGTGTEATNNAVGSFYGVSSTHFSYKVYHTSAFSSSQTYELHSTTLTPTFISDIVVGAPALSINSRTHTWGIPDVVEIRDAYGSSLASLTLDNSISNKKVFCNFW